MLTLNKEESSRGRGNAFIQQIFCGIFRRPGMHLAGRVSASQSLQSSQEMRGGLGNEGKDIDLRNI